MAQLLHGMLGSLVVEIYCDLSRQMLELHNGCRMVIGGGAIPKGMERIGCLNRRKYIYVWTTFITVARQSRNSLCNC